MDRVDDEGARTLDEIALDVFSARSRPDACHWNAAGIIYIPTAPQPFETVTIADRSALVLSDAASLTPSSMTRTT